MSVTTTIRWKILLLGASATCFVLSAVGVRPKWVELDRLGAAFFVLSFAAD